ncbi:hypothetical protein T10_5202 [Trichinella papuae]|uniref:Uncharacterized protein n=1 Tax=Trichinella papuae TaxID=268474 RepID=A0A0V1MF28_9BILA|nr:hypothetical protein T10_5202 [Trichinella papuae]
MSCFCDLIDLCEKLPGDYFKPMNPQASKGWIYIAAASLTTDVADDKGIYALGLSIAGVNADSDFSIHYIEM